MPGLDVASVLLVPQPRVRTTLSLAPLLPGACPERHVGGWPLLSVETQRLAQVARGQRCSPGRGRLAEKCGARAEAGRGRVRGLGFRHGR